MNELNQQKQYEHAGITDAQKDKLESVRQELGGEVFFSTASDSAGKSHKKLVLIYDKQ